MPWAHEVDGTVSLRWDHRGLRGFAMAHRRQVLALFAGCLLIAAWSSPASARPAHHSARHGVIVDTSDYQSVDQLLTNTQVLVVAKVESVAVDRAAPASQPASAVTLKVKDVVRGHLGKQVVVWQPRGAESQGSLDAQRPLQRNRTYLLCLARAPHAGPFYIVGGRAGEFTYDGKTKTFTTLDPLATWEPTNFALSLVKAGANIFPAGGPPAPSWLANASGAPGSPTVAWSAMVNDLGLSLSDVSCPSESLCVFAGEVSPTSSGVEIPAVSVSSGPFSPHANIVGTTTTFPPSSDYAGSSVACPSEGLCVLSSVDGIYATTDMAAHWTLEVAPASGKYFGDVSCPTVSFCAVAMGFGVLVSTAPTGGSAAWNPIRFDQGGIQALSCPSVELCVGGGGADDSSVGGWIETSTDPLAPASWYGGSTKHPAFAQHSGQYSVTGISCPTTAFCIAADLGGAPLVSTDPAGGVRTWNEVADGSGNPGFATCTTRGQCSVSGVGAFSATPGAPGSGIVGYPLPGVSCVSTSFCITTDDDQLAIGKEAG
jgi:hypothetical protein